MVEAVRSGESQRSVARRFQVSLPTVQYWVARAGDRRLDRVAWSDRRRGPVRPVNRTAEGVEALVLQVREELYRHSDLGEHGAGAIGRELCARGVKDVPSERTIGRILARRGALDGRYRVRRPAPPRGWYLSAVAAGEAELDQFDIVEGLKIKDGPLVEVLNGVSLHGGLVVSWPVAKSMSARFVSEALPEHWRAVGLPGYVQFDNDTVFQGPHQHRDVISSVMRVCLSLEVVPVFAPARESGFQASIENYNGQWQGKVWARFVHGSVEELRGRSAKYVAAHRQRTAVRRDGAPQRRAFPAEWEMDWQAHPQGRVVYIRRTSEQGRVFLLGRHVSVDRHWLHRLVRCEVDLTENQIRFYQLRRRAPSEQPLLNEVPYELPRRPFKR